VTPEQQESAGAWLEARNLATFQATIETHQQRRKERREAAFRKGLADEAARQELPPAPSPASVAPVITQRPVLELRRVDRQAREVQVVTRRKFARNNGRSAPSLNEK